MANLVLIHGRDQQGKDPVALKNTWVDTLKKGLTKSGVSLPVDTNIIFPFYGDYMDDLVQQSRQALAGGIVQERGQAGDEEEAAFYNEFLSEVAKNANISDNDIQARLEAEVMERGPLNWGWVHAILKVLDERTGFGEWSVRKWTEDVYLYLTKPGIRQLVNDFVRKEIGTKPCVLVGHSLGSIVGYDIIRYQDAFTVKSYITVGSPLGLTSINSKLKKPLNRPDCIEKDWFNSYDDRDVVALNPLSSRYFPINPEISNKNDVKNHTKNRHGIEGYLDDKDVARYIYDQLILQ